VWGFPITIGLRQAIAVHTGVMGVEKASSEGPGGTSDASVFGQIL
jgi:hypothetical protein